MLGKIFESLILQLEKDPDKDLRKLTGSYYTPRPIVHFMCQESLKEYLVTQLAGDDVTKAEVAREKLGKLIAMPPADQLDDEQAKILSEILSETEAKALRQAILDCRVCDPAVGSGAFPVGMLHEMVATVGKLDRGIHGQGILVQRNYHYDLKKQIIESCLYGVDIQEQAVRLCELRLWLSLVVDYQIDSEKSFSRAIREIPSLPNLSYRVMRGDSLLERLFGHVVHLDHMAKDARTKQLIESIQADKQSYFREGNTGEKRRLELKILAKQADLAERLIESKRALMVKHQPSIFGEEGMTANDRRAKTERDTQIKELTDLALKVSAAKTEIERLAGQKGTVDRGDFDSLRRKFFNTGSYPTFIWRLDFAEVFAVKGGFNILIANPPYRKERDSKELMAEIRGSRRWSMWYEGKMDFWNLFLHQSFDLCAPNGIVHFITSRYWLAGHGASKLIRRIRDEMAIRMICDLGKLKVFDKVSGQHMTAMYQNTQFDCPLTVKTFLKQDGTSNIESILSLSDNSQISVSHYPNDDILFQSKKRIHLAPREFHQLIEIMQQNAVPLSSRYEVRQGIAQNPDRISAKVARKYNERYKKGAGVFVLTDRELSDLQLPPREMKFVRPFFEDRQIYRYYCEKKNDHWLLYLTRDNLTDISSLPNIKKHLLQYRELMESRRETISGANEWFHLHWPREERLFEGPKIVGLQMAARPTFGFSSGSCYVGFACNIIKTKLREDALFFLLGILNSRLAWKWFSKNAKARGVGLDIGGTVLKNFPLPQNMHNDAAKRLIRYTQEIYMESIRKRPVNPCLEQKIEQEVMLLYDVPSNCLNYERECS